MGWYRTGTCSLTNGSAAIVGSGTAWVDNGVTVGDVFKAPDGKDYEVLSVGSNIGITLATNYLGSTASAQAYAVVMLGLTPAAVALRAKVALDAATAVVSATVRTDTAAQGLNTTQQGNARTNILALTAADVGAGRLSKSVAGSSDVTLSATEAAYEFIEYTGVLTGNINIIVPTTARGMKHLNSTTGAFTLTVKTSAGSGLAIGQGGRAMLASDGTNVVNQLTYVAGALTINGSITQGGGSFVIGAEGGIYQNAAGLDLVPSAGRSFRVLNVAQTLERFKVAESTGNTLIVGTVNVGNSTAANQLNVKGALGNSFGLAVDTLATLESSDAAAVGKGAAIALAGKSGNSVDPYPFAFIGGKKESAAAADYSGYMTFLVVNAGGGASELLRLSHTTGTSITGNLSATGNRPLSVNTTDGAVRIRGDAGGWSTLFGFLGSGGTDRGGFGALGSADIITNFWIGASYTAQWMSIASTGTSIAGNLTIAGSSALRGSHGGGGVTNSLALGDGAIASSATGTHNTAVGYSALTAVTTGSLNVAVGSNALIANLGGGQNTAVGVNALMANLGGSYNIAVGLSSLVANLGGSYNTAVGHAALYNNTSGSGNTGIGPITSGGTFSPVYDPTTQNDRFCMGSTSVTNAYIQVAWTVVSDARDKIDFAPVPHGLDFVCQLQPTAYRYKPDREATEGHGPVRYGFKAQDVLALEGSNPVIVDAEDPDKLRFNDQSMIAVLVNALQELNAKFDAYVLTHP